jgi:hypothetical protein
MSALLLNDQNDGVAVKPDQDHSEMGATVGGSLQTAYGRA